MKDPEKWAGGGGVCDLVGKLVKGQGRILQEKREKWSKCLRANSAERGL